MTHSESHPSQRSQFQQPVTHESDIPSQPQANVSDYRGSGKLRGKVALITGGDSGIGHAVAVAFAREGANCAIVYLDAYEDARAVKQEIEDLGRSCLTIAGDVGNERFCQQAVQQTVTTLGKLDILVNNAAEQHPQSSIEEISEGQLEQTFRTNIFSMFFMTKADRKSVV